MNKPYYSFLTTILRFLGAGKRHPEGQERYLYLFDRNREINSIFKNIAYFLKHKEMIHKPYTPNRLFLMHRFLLDEFKKNIIEMKRRKR